MSYSPAEINRKKLVARQKLAAKRNLQNSNSQQIGSPSKYFSTKSSTSAKDHTYKPYDSSKQSSTYKQHSANKTVLQFYGKTITGKLELLSTEKFCVVFSGYSQLAIQVIKTIPSAAYNPSSKHWSFNVQDHDLLQKRMATLKPSVAIDEIPLNVRNMCLNKKDSNVYDLGKIDAELLTALMPFQQEGVCFGIDKNGRCMIADEMGLGKTFQALAIANYYKEDWPLLIVTTSSMKKTWEETIYKYLPTVPITQVQYLSSGRENIIYNLSVLIVSYELMVRCEDKILNKGFGVIIIDESHVLKNFKAKCTKTATELSKYAKRVILLSGTPALSRPSELFTQLTLIDKTFFISFKHYSVRYCDGKTTNFGWDSSGHSNLKELEIVLMNKFMIRRTKEDVLKTLPNKTQEVITLNVNLNQFSDEDRNSLLALATKYDRVHNDKHAVLLLFFAQTSKIKIPAVCSYILQVLEKPVKFLVFAHHQVMLDAIEKVLEEKRKSFIRIDGNTLADRRKFLVDKFQHDDSYVCALLSITAANAGITLTAAELVLFAELHWSPSILNQAEARAHRIGQNKHVTVQYLIAPGTSDDSVWPLLQSKQKTLNKAGLMANSFQDVSVKLQTGDRNEQIARSLNSSITCANTLDISTYFSSPANTKMSTHTSNHSLEEDMLNDDLDDIFSNVDINM